MQEEKLAILRSFCEHSADANCLESLVFTILRRFWLCVEPVEDQINRNKIDWVAARDLVSDAIAVQHRLCQLNPTLESTEFLAELLSRLAQIEYQLGNAVASAAAIAQYRATKFGNTPQYQWTASQRFHGLLTSAWADLVADAQPEARRKLAEAVAVVHAAGLWGLLYQGLASQSLVDRLGVSAALFGVNPSEGDVAAASSAVLTAMRTRTKGIGNEPFDSSERRFGQFSQSFSG
ncbi:MAG: hypothetical protein IPF55_13315 [Rhodoferax sp.]|nr:hypothetical protein [Rhodoferax sp.]